MKYQLRNPWSGCFSHFLLCDVLKNRKSVPKCQSDDQLLSCESQCVIALLNFATWLYFPGCLGVESNQGIPQLHRGWLIHVRFSPPWIWAFVYHFSWTVDLGKEYDTNYYFASDSPSICPRQFITVSATKLVGIYLMCLLTHPSQFFFSIHDSEMCCSRRNETCQTASLTKCVKNMKFLIQAVSCHVNPSIKMLNLPKFEKHHASFFFRYRKQSLWPSDLH